MRGFVRGFERPALARISNTDNCFLDWALAPIQSEHGVRSACVVALGRVRELQLVSESTGQQLHELVFPSRQQQLLSLHLALHII